MTTPPAASPHTLRIPWTTFLFTNTKLSPLWLIIRVYVGWQWVVDGWGKITGAAWTGDKAGSALHTFVTGALQKTSGAHPDVQNWYAAFLRSFVDHHTVLFSYLVAYGELLVGIALILGLFTALAAFFGAFMNMNYLLAGAVSVNPIFLMLEFLLLLSWRTAGWLGLDHFVLTRIPFLQPKPVTNK